MRRIPALDMLRGVAILLVIGHHFFVPAPPEGPAAYWAVSLFFRRLGWTGVDLFFVLSGFLVGGLLFTELAERGTLRAGRFLVRRGFKIWPGYLALLVWMTVAAVAGWHVPGVDDGSPVQAMPDADRWARLAGMLAPNWLHLQNYWSTTRIHTWSLAVEEHVYLALPFLVMFLARTGRIASARTPWILSGLAASAFAGRVLTWATAPAGADVLWTLAYPTHLRVDSLLCGVLLAWVSRFRPGAWQTLQRRPAICASVGLALVLPVGLGGSAAPWVNVAGLTSLYLGYGLILIATLSVPLDAPGVAMRGVAAIGVYSYSIYLWHLDFAALPTRALAGMVRDWPLLVSWPALFLTQFVLAISAGAVLAKAVEFPLLRLRDRLIPR